MRRELSECSLCSNPHAFVNKKGEAILVRMLGERWEEQLAKMYLAYEPRNSFNGLPPIDDDACAKWVEGMIRDAINIIAVSFWEGVVGHASLFPMAEHSCEMLLVVARRFQNCGIGTQLAHCAVQLCGEVGFDRIWLSVGSSNYRARHVCEKCGFERLAVESAGGIDMAIDLARFRDVMAEPVSSVMNRNVLTISADSECKSAIEIFVVKNIAALPVVDKQRELKGILCETDMLRPTDYARKVGEIMTREVVSVDEDTPLESMIRLFQHRKLRCIPVLGKDGKLVGIVGRKDILSYYTMRLGVLK